MSDGVNSLEQKIQLFEDLLDEMKQATREAHSAAKALRQERKELEKYISDKGKALVEERVDEVVRIELEKIMPSMRKETNAIYDKVGKEVDNLINIALGSKFAKKNGKEDLRPLLAAKLHDFIQEIITKEGL